MAEKDYIVFRTDFGHLEQFLNNYSTEFPFYRVYQILHEHCHDGALVVVILARMDI